MSKLALKITLSRDFRHSLLRSMSRLLAAYASSHSSLTCCLSQLLPSQLCGLHATHHVKYISYKARGKAFSSFALYRLDTSIHYYLLSVIQANVPKLPYLTTLQGYVNTKPFLSIVKHYFLI